MLFSSTDTCPRRRYGSGPGMRRSRSERSAVKRRAVGVESEYETVRIGTEESGASPWEGAAVPLRHSAEPDPEQEQRLRIIAAGARRRRALRRLALGASIAAALGMIAALGSRSSET